MNVSQILGIMTLVERGIMSVATVMAMREAGISDDKILETISSLNRMHEQHQSLDLRQ